MSILCFERKSKVKLALLAMHPYLWIPYLALNLTDYLKSCRQCLWWNHGEMKLDLKYGMESHERCTRERTIPDFWRCLSQV